MSRAIKGEDPNDKAARYRSILKAIQEHKLSVYHNNMVVIKAPPHTLTFDPQCGTVGITRPAIPREKGEVLAEAELWERAHWSKETTLKQKP